MDSNGAIFACEELPVAGELFSEAEANAVLARHSGNAAFEDVLRTAESSDLPRVLARYIHFNSVFGSGVAQLAGAIGSRPDLFRDSSEPVDLLADRSSEVAAKIFFAAIDEFGDHSAMRRGTHRCLAQTTLRAVAAFGGCEDMNGAGFINKTTEAAMARVRGGYVVNQFPRHDALLRAIGFHIGSETLADGEFCALDRILRERFPELVEALEDKKWQAGPPPYFWIQIHTTAEAEHSMAAFDAANLAIRYYAGPGGAGAAREWIVQGIHEFAAVQTEFMQDLLS
jgi:hypothetical protein